MNLINELETELASYLKFKHCIVCNSGTAALHSIYLAHNLKDTIVITTPYTYYSTVNMLLVIGAVPDFVDINRDDYLINPELVKEAIKSIDLKIGAIVGVNLFGKEIDYDKLTFANIPLIVDSCQCCKPGIRGDAVAFSFQRSKNFNCGEGGCICTNDDEIARKCRIIVNQGEDGKYNTVMLGYNYRMSDYQALVVYNQIKYHNVGGEAELGRWGPKQGHYPRLIYEQQFYKENGYYDLWTKKCPVAEDLARQVREQWMK